MPAEREGAIRTIVVDDHRSYAEALGMALARAEGIECVGTVDSVVDATAEVKLRKPDVVILDWQMPDTDGVEGIGRINSSRCPGAPATRCTAPARRVVHG